MIPGDRPQLFHDLQLVHYPIRTTRHIDPLQGHIIPPRFALFRPGLVFLVQISCCRFIRLAVDLGYVRLEVPAVRDVNRVPPKAILERKSVNIDRFIDRGERSCRRAEGSVSISFGDRRQDR